MGGKHRPDGDGAPTLGEKTEKGKRGRAKETSSVPTVLLFVFILISSMISLCSELVLILILIYNLAPIG
jgi:hypothetical protein